MKERQKPEKFLLPHGMPSDEREVAFSSRVPLKALKIKAPYKSWHYQCTYIDIPRARCWGAGLEEPSGHTGLRPLSDIKPRVIWHGKKRFQLLAGGGNALFIKHPHVIP